LVVQSEHNPAAALVRPIARRRGNGNTNSACDAWSVPCLTYGYLSSLLGYQLILPGDRSTLPLCRTRCVNLPAHGWTQLIQFTFSTVTLYLVSELGHLSSLVLTFQAIKKCKHYFIIAAS